MQVITQQRFGGPDVLEIAQVPDARPLPTEVLVEVRAVGLNPLETRVRSGDLPALGEPPFVLGWDVSGVVIESRSWRFAVGDEVFGMPMFPREAGAYAELVAAPALHLAKKPPALSHVEAAALPVVGSTAWQGLVDIARIRPGDRVLVHGGGGGVGHVAVQIAKAFGAHVIATAGADKRQFVADLGADEVVDYTAADATGEIRDVDVVLDPVGGRAAAVSLEMLRPGGHLVTAVADDDLGLAARFAAAGKRFSGIAVDPDGMASDIHADQEYRAHLGGVMARRAVAAAK